MASTLGNVVKGTIDKTTLQHPGCYRQPTGLRLKSQFTFKVTYRVACDKRGGLSRDGYETNRSALWTEVTSRMKERAELSRLRPPVNSTIAIGGPTRIAALEVTR